MANSSSKALGIAIQAHARDLLGYSQPDPDTAARDGRRLEQGLCDRLSALGKDAEHLLSVEPDDALDKLEALEREAAGEDAGVMATARRIRAQEEKTFDARTNDPWRDDRMRPSEHSGSVRKGRRGKRGQH